MTCPVCGAPNNCRLDSGESYRGPCWCDAISVPVALIRALADSGVDARCVCEACLKTLARGQMPILAELPETETVRSPCVGVCKLDPENVCRGCLRTIDEISAWGTLDPDEKRRVLSVLPSRRPPE